MDRDLWLQSFDKNTLPAWPCPICDKGHAVPRRRCFNQGETVSSIRMRQSEDWEPEWIEYIFTSWGKCSNPSCEQLFAVSGTGGLAPSFTEEHGTEWSDFFNARNCIPMPHIIKLPSKCPAEVKEPLFDAFSMFWLSPEACAGRIRVSLECLMNHLGIPKTITTKKGKPADLTLHGRLDKFASIDPKNGPPLIALKWLGNAGSHESSSVSHSDLLDAFEIMEHALSEIIDDRSARVAALAKKLTNKHRR
jgi:hypothetical protein